MRVIGLTGGVATGKSTVARMLREEHRVPVIDADQVARDVVAPGTPGLEAVVARFGPGILREDGSLDRAKLRGIVIHDADARRDLEAITHPAIRTAVGGRLAELAIQGVPAAVVEAALMVETGSHRLYHAVIVVSCSEETQLRRLVERDGQTEADARALIAAQLPLADKERAATVVVRNDGDLDDLREQVRRAWALVST